MPINTVAGGGKQSLDVRKLGQFLGRHDAEKFVILLQRPQVV